MANDPTVVRQTEAANTGTSAPTVVQSREKNVLYNYRSSTYNFTISALRNKDINDPKTYRNNSLDLIVLKSGGKGDSVLKLTDSFNTKAILNSEQAQDSRASFAKTDPRRVDITPQDKEAPLKNYSADFLQGFNERSPGRFDMFIDNVEINTIIEGDGQTVMTQPTSISFDVIEPYSMNGFIEALHVSAVSAGHLTYQDAPFLLKLQFAGYPDSPEFPTVVSEIENSTRYFPFKISKVEITVDERGTKYQVSAMSYGDSGLGTSSVLKKSVKATGNTIQQMTQDLVKQVTSQTHDDDAKSKNNKLSADAYDEYRVKFPVWDSTKGFVDGDNSINDIGKSKLIEELKDNAINSFPDPGNPTKPDAYDPRSSKQPSPQQSAASPESNKLTPTTAPISQFGEGKSIQECIEAIIKDSEYIKNIAKKLSSKSEWSQVVDDFGMVDYFLIKLELTNKETLNPDSKKPYQIFNYVVTPRKIRYNRFPGYSNDFIDENKLSRLSLREYDYLYTGKNLDVLNFKLNFNTLYFDANPAALGNENVPPAKFAGAPGNKTDIKSNPDNINQAKSNQIPASPQKSDPNQTSVDKNAGGQNKFDAYSKLAKSMHQGITNPGGAMLSGEIDILGDPFYVVTGGVGNYNPAPSTSSPHQTVDGDAAHNYSEVLVTINFRNPIDIDSLEQGGRAYFDPELIPFSGLYMVTSAKSVFKDGMFKQTLQIIRVPGESSKISTNSRSMSATVPSNKFTQSPNPEDQTIQDSTPASPVINTDTGQTGDRATTVTLGNQLQRGLPSPGLPGVLSNFTNASGGLGGSNNYLLSQISGATPNLGSNTRIARQLFGGVVPGGINQGIPLQVSAVANLQQQILNPASLVSQVGNTALRQFGITNPNAQLAAVLIGKASQAINQVSVPGSGIGAGSTVNYTPVTPVTTLVDSNQTVTAQDVRSQNSTLPTSALAIAGLASGLDPRTMATVAALGTIGAGLVNKIKSNATSVTQGTPTDPIATAQKFGVDPTQLSGLSAPLQSRVLDQMSNIASTVPANTDLSVASSQGINLKSLSPQGIANLPPTAPYAVAPGPAPDTQYINSIAQSGGSTAVANAYGVKNVANIPQNLLSSAELKSALLPSPSLGTAGNLLMAAVAGSKYLSGNLQLSNLVGSALSKEAGLTTIQNNFGATLNTGGNLSNAVTNRFGSRSQGNSPLDKLNIQSSGSPQVPDRTSDTGAG